jgi:hypothetical protein
VFSRRLVVLGFLCVIAFVVESGIENWSALFLESELDASPAVGGLGPGLFAAAMVSGRSLGQLLEARIGDRALLAGGALGAGAGLALAAASPGSPPPSPVSCSEAQASPWPPRRSSERPAAARATSSVAARSRQ